MGKPKKRKKSLHVGRGDMRVASADLPHNADPAEVVIEAPDTGQKVLVTKQLRDAPLDRLHARKQINEVQYQAGCKARELFEVFGSDGVRAMDFGKPFVDGGAGGALGVTDMQIRAAKRLQVARGYLGKEGFDLICDVLGHRKFIEQVASERGLDGKREQLYLGRRFRECLDSLAILLGITVIGKGPKQKPDSFTVLAAGVSHPALHRAMTAARDTERLNAASRAATMGVKAAAQTKLTLPNKGRAA